MRLAALALVMSLPACTLGAIGATSSAIGIHNELSDDHWSYATPLLISAAIGLVIDVTFLIIMERESAKPMI